MQFAKLCQILAATALVASLVLAQTSQQPALDHIQWVKFEDRNELAFTNQKAFTMDVPRGWPVDGGMARLSALQVGPYVRMLATDGSVYLVIGNADTPFYMIPNKTRPRVGEKYRPNDTGQVTEVEPYIAGARYAEQIGPKVLGDACLGFKFTAIKERPDVRDKQLQLYGGRLPDSNLGDHSARLDAGEATWSCEQWR